MCKFFSFISTGYGHFFYFDAGLRAKIRNGEIDSMLTQDSHASIAHYFQSIGRLAKGEDGCNKYEYNPLTGDFRVDQINTKNDAESAEKWVRKLDCTTVVPELVIKEIVFPFEDELPKRISAKEKHLLHEWVSVGDSVEDSVEDSVRDSVGDSVGWSVWYLIWDFVQGSVRDSVGPLDWDSVGPLDWDSVRDSVVAYTGSFVALDNWGNIDHEPGVYPFQSAVELWERGLVPSFDATTWRLHGGPDAKIMYEITDEELKGKK